MLRKSNHPIPANFSNYQAFRCLCLNTQDVRKKTFSFNNTFRNVNNQHHKIDNLRATNDCSDERSMARTIDQRDLKRLKPKICNGHAIKNQNNIYVVALVESPPQSTRILCTLSNCHQYFPFTEIESDSALLALRVFIKCCG